MPVINGGRARFYQPCNHSDCGQEGLNIYRFLNRENADSCYDFYDFVCGKYLQFKTRASETPALVYKVNNKVQLNIREMLKMPDYDNFNIKPFELIKRFYKLCENKPERDRKGLSALKQIILENFGNWPLLIGDDWMGDKFDWMKFTYNLHRNWFTRNYLLSFYIVPIPEQNDKQIIQLGPPKFVMGKKYYNENGNASVNYTKIYYDYMVSVVGEFGVNNANNDTTINSNLDNDLKDILIFEKKLAMICSYCMNVNNRSTYTTIKQLQDLLPDIPWLKFINKILEPVTVTEEETIIVKSIEYLVQFSSVILKTPKRVQANYLIWRLVTDAMPYLTRKLGRLTTKFYKATEQHKTLAYKWIPCAAMTIKKFRVATAALYARLYGSKKVRDQVNQLVGNIRVQLNKTIDTFYWMDAETKARAQYKIAAIQAYVGYPDEFFNDDILIKYYKNMVINNDDYLLSALNVTVFYNRLRSKQYNISVRRLNWTEYAVQNFIRIEYSQTKNSLYVPISVLTGVYYNPNLPSALNYGAIGTIIAHKMVHAIFHRGAHHDHKGSYGKWWTTKTEENFYNISKCFIDQYNRYWVPEVNMFVNGALTLFENIADTLGVKIAYNAFKISMKSLDYQTLPLVPFSRNDLFWISYARMRCTKYDEQYLVNMLNTNTKPPARYQVNGPAHNMKLFSSNFFCEERSRMNAGKICALD